MFQGHVKDSSSTVLLAGIYALFLVFLKSQWIKDFYQIYVYFSVSWNVDTAECPILRLKIYGIHSLNVNSGYHYRGQIVIPVVTNVFGLCSVRMTENINQHRYSNLLHNA